MTQRILPGALKFIQKHDKKINNKHTQNNINNPIKSNNGGQYQNQTKLSESPNPNHNNIEPKHPSSNFVAKNNLAIG